jgi:glycosyltransferase involved in cell wall biosynthesis
VYIYIGRITQDKGLLDLASAFSKLKPGEAFLVFVGPDEGGLIDKIKNVCASHNDYVRFVDYTLFPQMYLAGADVLCLPSYREGFGNVIIEAAAIGLPAVASKIYGISDAVQNHKTGLLHARGNINSIATCLKFFLENREFVKVYGLAAQKRAVNEFDANILSKHWFDFYLKHLP